MLYCKFTLICNIMNIKKIKGDELVSFFKEKLNNYQFTPKTQRSLVPGAKRLASFMELSGIVMYDSSIGERFVKHEKDILSLSAMVLERDTRSIYLLNIMLDGKEYHLKCGPKSYDFPGEIGKVAEEFIEKVSSQLRFHDSTKTSYRSSLSKFCVLMDIEDITLNKLCRHNIIHFLSSIRNTRSYVTTPIKKFLKYIFENKFVEQDFSDLLSNFKPRDKEKMPSYYDKDEIAIIEKTINRESGIGKRNYAMILLGTRLGLRGSDIVNLKFLDIDWENSLLKLTQVKSDREIKLPLTADVGNAIIDYIKNGRPSSKLKTIFLTARHPLRPMDASAYSCMVSRIISNAGIDVGNRHHSSHSLRHSLATNLMKNGVGLPVISEVLGHRSTDSTMFYVSVDIMSLLSCSLEVTMIPDTFYEQKGGYFYE